MQYNTSRDKMTIREYGRGVQKMVDHITAITDDKERQDAAETLVEVMNILNPQNVTVEDPLHKLWDHMIMMSDYKMKVESPYEMPTAEVKQAKPEPLPYPKERLEFRHLGKKFGILLEKAMAEKDEEKKQGFVHTLALFMRVAYNNWHDEKMHDDQIQNEIKQLSKGALVYEPGRFAEFVDGGDGPIINHKSFSENNDKVNFKKKKGNNSNSKHRRSNNSNNKYKKNYRR